MKKLICIIMSAIIIIMLFMPSFTICAADTNESKKITEFTNGIADLARKYDSEKEFVAPEEDETAQIQAFSARNSEEVTDSTETEYTLQDFQTARLIVRADSKFNKCGALEDVSGFEDFHILQYESPKAAMLAFKQLQSEKNITKIAPDEVVAGLQGEISENTVGISKDYLCAWSTDRTQSKRLQDYLKANNIQMREIIVGVVDTGVDYNHEFLKGRLIHPKFDFPKNSNTEEGEESIYKSHGTAVCSVIVDNTPENVKIIMYNGFDENGKSTEARLAAAVIAAADEEVDLINASWTAYDSADVISASLDYAYQKNIPVFACVGNDDGANMYFLPANKKECIAVAATDLDNTAADWNIVTPNTDISAPGEDVKVAAFHNKYETWRGTSFSTPCVASIGAILLSVSPNMSVDALKTRLKETALPVKYQNFYHSSQGEYFDNVESLYIGSGIVQFCDAFGLEDECAVPEIHMETKVYVGEQKCEITCADKNATILYTTDGSYPDLQNATMYTEPFSITERTRIRAVAYYADSGYHGEETEVTPRIQYIDDDSAFKIDADGIIHEYTGSIADLYVQEKINGIQVTGFVAGAFRKGTLLSLTLPETVTEIPANAFYEDTSLEFIRAAGVTNIEMSAFCNSALMYAEFPNTKVIENGAFAYASKFYGGDFSSVETIKRAAFQYSKIRSFDGPQVKELAPAAFRCCNSLERVYFPQVSFYTGIPVYGIFEDCSLLREVVMPAETALPLKSFRSSNITEAYFPFLEKIGTSAFEMCICLEKIYMPSLLEIPKNAFGGSTSSNPRAKSRAYFFDNVKMIGENVFGVYPTSRIEFSHLESAQSLPQTEGCIISMPSTFRECTEDTKVRNYKVYGTKGTYAEQWANENGHKFIEVSQDTAVLTQLPEKYTDADGVLTADVIGFNRTYQWYANDTNDNTTGTPIPNVTGKEFNPADYPAKYYYCVVTSTDVGYNPIEIRTNVTENTTYQSADYTEYNKAVEQAKALDRSLYTDLTELDEALSADISGLSNSQQNIVDEQTAKIKAALDNLVLKPADYSRVNEQINTVPEHLEYYTDETVNALNKILSGIDYGLDITKQEVVDSYAEQLQNAISALEYKPADYTEYDKAVAKAKGLDKEKYVDFSQVEKELAVDVGGKNITQQEEVDLQTKAILAAIDALEEKTPKQPIINLEQDKTNGNTTPDKPSKNESVISPMTGSETYTGVFTALAALSFATVLLVRKKKDN